MKYSIRNVNSEFVLNLNNGKTSVGIPLQTLTPESVHGILVKHGEWIDDTFGIEGLKCLMNIHYHVVNLFDKQLD